MKAPRVRLRMSWGYPKLSKWVFILNGNTWGTRVPTKIREPWVWCFQISRCVSIKQRHWTSRTRYGTFKFGLGDGDAKVLPGFDSHQSFFRYVASTVCFAWNLVAGKPPHSQPSRCRQRSAGGNEKNVWFLLWFKTQDQWGFTVIFEPSNSAQVWPEPLRLP